ncbi:glycine zipper domain-containing protein [Synechococcus sp.]
MDSSNPTSSVGQVGELFRERFAELLPVIQKQWPQITQDTLTSTRGSFDEVVLLISDQTGRTATVIQEQLLGFLEVASDQGRRLGDRLQPLEEQLEQLLDDLNANLRPKIEQPVRERPLLALGLAAGVGLLAGLLLSGRRR